MNQVGIRELRHQLRHYLSLVEAGEAFEVTLFGRPVAHLGPLRKGHGRLEELIQQGRLTPPLNADSTRLPPPARAITGTTATDALLAERRGDPR